MSGHEDEEYRFSRTDHELLQELRDILGFEELHQLRADLQSVIRYRSVYHRVRFWAALAAAMTYCLGAVLFLGGPQRISANAYWVISTYGGHDLWGIMFMSAATFTALCVWKFHRALRYALLVQSIPFSLIAISFAIAAVKYADANLTAAPIYGWIMVMHVFLSDYARKEF